MNRRDALILLSSVAAFLEGGCSEENVFTWTEDVSLTDGTSVLVKRTTALQTNDIAGGGGGSFVKSMNLQIISPSRSDLPAPWSDAYVPILLDKDPRNQEWFLIATFFHCDSWKKLGKPDLPYAEYRFRGGKWVLKNLSKNLIGRKSNLYIADRRPPSEHIDVKQKDEFVKKPGIGKKYLSIISTWQSNC